MSVSTHPKAAALREFAGHFPTGVTVVTACDGNGQSHGMTVSSVTSVSLDPPLLLVCLANTSKTFHALEQSGVFCIHVLADHQSAIATTFSRKGNDKFRDVSHRHTTLGAPLIEEALASAECRVTKTVPGGDHTIVIGELQQTHVRLGTPLLYYRGQLHRNLALAS